MALNHTVMPEYEEIIVDEKEVDVQKEDVGGGGGIKYQAQSPDEAALVTAARCFGYVFTNRSSESVTVSRLDKEQG